MGNSADAFITYPIPSTGSASATFVRTIGQVNCARTTVVCSPLGGMTGSYLALPANPNRVRMTILNSGSLSMGVAAHFFVPNLPATPSNHWDNIIPGSNAIQQGNQPAAQGAAFEAHQPVYTGPVHVAWFGPCTLSGSVAIITEGIVGTDTPT